MEKLHMLYSEYLRKTPFWERMMLDIYLDIKDKKSSLGDAEMEEKRRQETIKGYK